MECASVSFSGGGGLKFWLEAYSTATQTNVSFTPKVSDANVSAVIKPKGTGALLASIPDGTSVGGNARGAYAVDLQMSRTAANQVAGSTASTIGGGYRNIIIGQDTTYSTIAGGENNQINAVNGNHTIGGGTGNEILNNNNEGSCVIAGGHFNQMRSGMSVISGGRFNDTNNASQYYQVIAGGFSNNTSAEGGTISGGGSNNVSGNYSVIGGGQSNTVNVAHAIIGGGSSNTTSGTYAFVGGGLSNTASGTAGVIAGGTNNLSQVYKGFVGGGGTNTANAFGSISGGFTNITNSNVAIGTVTVTLTAGSTLIPNGYISTSNSPMNALITGTGIADNTFISMTSPPNLTMSNPATASGSVTLSYWNVGGTVGGGRSNSATGLYSAITGGLSNTASSNHTFVGGGRGNSVSGAFSDSYSLICGGFSNTVSGNYDVLVGGSSNSISGTNNGNHRFIGGGSSNSLGEQCLYSIIVGGATNSIFGRNSFIGGGASNAMSEGSWSVIAGGQTNTMSGSGTHKTISGGTGNTVSGYVAVVSGGQSNTASGSLSSVGGGQSNVASGGASFIGGGQGNTASTTYTSVMGGLQAVASLYGQQAYASGRFAADGDAQAHELIWRRAITGTANTELFLDGASIRAVLPANTVWKGIINFAAVCTSPGGGSTILGDVAAIDYTVTIKRIAGITVLVAAASNISGLDSDASMTTSAFVIAADVPTQSLSLSFTPPNTAGANTVIRVVATFRGLQIQY